MAKLFDVGGQFPDQASLQRLAKYERGRIAFEGRLAEISQRALQIYQNDSMRQVQYNQLSSLMIAVNLPDILLTKPADLMVGEPPTYESGLPDDSQEQRALNRIVEENGVTKMIHEMVIGMGYRGDAFLKVRVDYREDYSETPSGLPPEGVKREPIIEPIDPSFVFPELANNNRKKFKAINIAYVNWIDNGKEEEPYLTVERHVPGYIYYDQFKLSSPSADIVDGVPINVFQIEKQIGETKIEETGIPRMLVLHVPYKTTDEDWQGISGIEKIESVLQAINERLVQIDYILWKHADPVLYGPDLETNSDFSAGGAYLKLSKDDPTPGAITWDSQLSGAFKELDYLFAIIYQMSETPQWVFGTVISERGTDGGTGTSHTDSGVIQARFMPIISKVKRIRLYVEEAIRDALWTAMELENVANESVLGFEKYNAIYPTISWQDGIPRSIMELAEYMQLRTGNKPTLDVLSAIKRLDGVDDIQAKEIIERIEREDRLIEDSTLANRFIPGVDLDEGEGDS